MSALKDTERLVGYALSQALKVVECDTEASTVDLNLLSNLNTNQSLNYIKLEQQFTSMEKDANKMRAMKEELTLLLQDLDHIEKQADALGQVTLELDLWSKEIEHKLGQ